MTDSSTTADQTVLVLYPPRLPRATTPVTGAVYGVPKHIYDLEPMGCTVEVGAYGEQARGDTVSINLNGELALDSRQTQDINDTVTLYIPHGKLLPGIVNRLTYTVTRGSENLGTSEPPLEILYNSIRPGIEDTTPGDNAHSELVLLLPDEIKNGVGPGFTRATVCVAYPYCRAYDRIRLNCNGHDVYHTVTVTEAPAPPAHGSATPTTVCFEVTSADLRDDPEFRFSFTVNDQLNNSPDPDAPWSAVHTVDVDQAGSRLPQPIPREIASDAGDDPSIIDLDKLGANPLLLIVLTGDSRFMPDDTVEATYVVKVAGQPDVVVPARGTVETDGLGQKQACVLTIPNDKVIAGSTVQASYRLLRSTALVGTSKTARATVIGEGTGLDLDPPSVKEANGNSLDPVAAKDRLTIVVPPNAALRPDDKLKVTWTGAPGTPAGGSYISGESLVSAGLDIEIPNSVVAFNLGKSVKVSYEVIRGTETPIPSAVFNLAVQTLAQADLLLAKPKILEAANQGEGPELDLSTLSVDATCWLGTWPLIAPDQDVWLRLKGTKADGTTGYNWNIWAPPPRGPRVNPAWISQGKYEVPAPYAYLKELKDGSELTMEFKVDFNQTTSEPNAQIFPLRTYVIHLNQLAAPEITSVKDAKGVDIPDGTSTEETAVTLKGTGVSDKRVEIFDNLDSKGNAYVEGGIWTHPVIGLATGYHSFTAKGIYGTEPVSQSWTFTVGTSEIIDTTPHVFTKVIYTTSNFAPKNRYYDLERKPTGGTPPYTYRSSKPSVATVDVDEGGVLIKGAGTATITVRDSTGKASSYNVTASMVHDVIVNNGNAYMDAWQANTWATPYVQAGGFRPEFGWGTSLNTRFEIGSEWLYPDALIWAPPPLPPNGSWGFTSFASDIVSFTDNATQFAGRALICLRVIG
ncbi:hypothetical protein [Pseudomonas thivervalensis]|uniref:hypothetical protein n=1 Tax=Pseudomonas thivervalensis TaxID=86265 RepID=UPI003D65C9D5